MSLAAGNLAKRESERVRAGRRGLAARLRLPLMLVVPLALVVGAAYWYLTGGRYASTDDAYVQADKVALSSDVAGRVVAIEVHDNEAVGRGQVLFRLDDRPYRIAVERARAQLDDARLRVEGLRASYQQKQAEL
jgi:membrane fusion protein (multidrug efflux system)